MPRLFTKFIASFLVSLILLVSVYPTAQAAGAWYNQSYQEWSAKVYDASNPNEVFGERYTAAQVQWIIYSLGAVIVNTADGTGILNCFIAQGGDPTCVTQAIGNAEVLGKQFSLLHPQNQSWGNVLFPAGLISTRTYVNSVLATSPLVPEAHAQGFGFKALNPILTMWRASRNIAYSLFVVAIVIMAFMIMFRVKISPQVIITVQSALPKIVFALILVTFSYAISGLLIDLMYVVIGAISLLASQFFVIDGTQFIPPIAIFNLMTLGQPLNTPPGGAPTQVTVLGLFIIYLTFFVMGFGLSVFYLAGVIPGLIGTFAVGAILAGATAVTAGGILPILGVLALIILVLVIIILLIMFLRISWTLLKAYASIVLLTIFSPFYILVGVFIPGMGFGSWLRNYVSQLAIFVVTGVLFVMAFVFIYFGYLSAVSPTLLGEDAGARILNALFGSGNISRLDSDPRWPPLIGGGESAMVSLLFFGVSFVLFTITPRAAKMIESLMKGQPFAYGTAIGETVTGPTKFLLNLGPIRALRQETSEYTGGNLAGILSAITGSAGMTGTSTRLEEIRKRLQKE